jgi:hypothetical protein
MTSDAGDERPRVSAEYGARLSGASCHLGTSTIFFEGSRADFGHGCGADVKINRA